MQRQTGLRALQIIVTVGLTAVLASKVDWAALSLVVAQLCWDFIALGIGCVALSHLVNVLRWRYLLNAHLVSIRQLGVYYGAGLFASNFLPTSIGGDSVRILLLSRNVSLRQATVSVGLDRALGLAGLTAFFLPAYWYGLPPNLPVLNVAGVISSHRTQLYILALIAVGLTLIAAVVWRANSQLRTYVLLRFTQFRGTSGAIQQSARESAKRLFVAYGMSVVSQGLLIATHWAVLQSVGIVATASVVLWLVLTISFSMLLPISVNGLGFQESIYVAVLGAYGISSGLAIGVALLIRFLMILFSLIGGLISLGSHLPIAPTSVPRQASQPLLETAAPHDRDGC